MGRGAGRFCTRLASRTPRGGLAPESLLPAARDGNRSGAILAEIRRGRAADLPKLRATPLPGFAVHRQTGR